MCRYGQRHCNMPEKKTSTNNTRQRSFLICWLFVNVCRDKRNTDCIEPQLIANPKKITTPLLLTTSHKSRNQINSNTHHWRQCELVVCFFLFCFRDALPNVHNKFWRQGAICVSIFSHYYFSGHQKSAAAATAATAVAFPEFLVHEWVAVVADAFGSHMVVLKRISSLCFFPFVPFRFAKIIYFFFLSSKCTHTNSNAQNEKEFSARFL